MTFYVCKSKLRPKIHLKLFKETKLMILIEGIKYIVININYNFVKCRLFKRNFENIKNIL